jgi:hypothetical protein
MTEPVKKWLMPIREAMQSQHTSEPTRGNATSRRTVLMAGAIICVPFGHHLQAGLAAVKHVVLLGDSVFDNAAYVGRDPDVRRQLKDVLPKGSQVTLAARDGAVITDVASQLHGLPRDATHLIISVGGNDALLASGVLEERATSVSHALEKLAAIALGRLRAKLDARRALRFKGTGRTTRTPIRYRVVRPAMRCWRAWPMACRVGREPSRRAGHCSQQVSGSR